MGLTVTWTPKVCKIMAFMAILMGLGLLFTYFWGLGTITIVSITGKFTCATIKTISATILMISMIIWILSLVLCSGLRVEHSGCH